MRPKFRDIVLKLVGNKEELLIIPQRDLDLNPQAGKLGAHLEAGRVLYKDLQNTYK